MILQVSVSYSSKCRLCTSNFTKTVSIWKWSNTLFRFMYTPHAFNLTFLKNHLEFWTEIFRAIFLNIKAHIREVSSKSEMVTWRLFENCVTWAGMTLKQVKIFLLSKINTPNHFFSLCQVCCFNPWWPFNNGSIMFFVSFWWRFHFPL